MGDINRGEVNLRKFHNDFWADVATAEYREYKTGKEAELKRARRHLDEELDKEQLALAEEVADFEISSYLSELEAALYDFATNTEIGLALAEEEARIRHRYRGNDHETSKWVENIYIKLEMLSEQAEQIRVEYYMLPPATEFYFRDFDIHQEEREIIFLNMLEGTMEQEHYELEMALLDECLAATTIDEHQIALDYVEW